MFTLSYTHALHSRKQSHTMTCWYICTFTHAHAHTSLHIFSLYVARTLTLHTNTRAAAATKVLVALATNPEAFKGKEFKVVYACTCACARACKIMCACVRVCTCVPCNCRVSLQLRWTLFLSSDCISLLMCVFTQSEKEDSRHLKIANYAFHSHNCTRCVKHLFLIPHTHTHLLHTHAIAQALRASLPERCWCICTFTLTHAHTP